jgi:L,D-transpeptidase catalytic domain/Putative peptidoglycan binding domain
MRRAATALAVLASLALPAHAAAQTPTPTPTPPPVVPTPTPTPVPTPPPAKGKITLTAQGTFNKPHAAVLKGHSFTVRGVLRPYVAGERVVLRVYRNGHKLEAKQLTPLPVPGNAAGVFTLKVRGTKAGRLAIKATHAASPLLATVRSRTLRVQVVSPSVAPGERGPAVTLLQQMLARLHYAVPRSGVYDAGTQRAVLAWRKVVGASRNGIANSMVFNGLLKGRGRFHVRHPLDGRHVEARLGAQVLALIDGAKVVGIYHISSGKPSTPTVRGKFHVYMKTPGTNSEGMVDSNYFIRGYAIHGYFDVPVFAASHGCLRVPIPDARRIYDWLSIGDVVWVEE